MKRSEMLGQIWEVLYRETDLEAEGLKLLSEQILDAIEKKGMNPPDCDAPGLAGYQEWEKE